MTGYLADPRSMSDEVLAGWVADFKASPPSMDSFVESCWAGRVCDEARARGL